MKKRIKKINPWLSPFLMVMSLCFCIINLLGPDQSWSWVENRPLQSRSDIHLSEFGQDDFSSTVNTVVSDQFLGRQFLLKVNYCIRKALGQKEINDIYLGKDRLFLESQGAESSIALTNEEAFGKFLQEKKLQGALLVAPSSQNIYEEDLPQYISVKKEREILNGLMDSKTDHFSFIDLQPLFQENKAQELYYKTDHHWTTRGAAYASQLLLENLNQTMKLDDYNFMNVSNFFEGSLSSKAGSVGLYDSISIAPYGKQSDYVVTWADGTKTSSIYKEDALNQKDQYELFLGANQSVVQIDTQSDSERSLLILKDSYANSMIQFLLPYFSSITIVDPRYYSGDLSKLMETNGITDCVAVFSYDTFTTQKTFSNLLEGVLKPNVQSAQ